MAGPACVLGCCTACLCTEISPSDSVRDTEGSAPSSVDRCLEKGLRACQWQGKAAQRFGQVSTARHMDTNGRGVKDGDGPLRVFRRVVKSEHEGLNWWGLRHARKRGLGGARVTVCGAD